MCIPFALNGELGKSIPIYCKKHTGGSNSLGMPHGIKIQMDCIKPWIKNSLRVSLCLTRRKNATTVLENIAKQHCMPQFSGVKRSLLRNGVN